MPELPPKKPSPTSPAGSHAVSASSAHTKTLPEKPCSGEHDVPSSTKHEELPSFEDANRGEQAALPASRQRSDDARGHQNGGPVFHVPPPPTEEPQDPEPPALPPKTVPPVPEVRKSKAPRPPVPPKPRHVSRNVFLTLCTYICTAHVP